MTSILFGEWREKLESEGIFKNENDPKKWVINEENLEDIMEALQLDEYF